MPLPLQRRLRFGDIALRDAISDGDTPGPRTLAAGYALGIKGGHCDNNLLPPEYKDVGNGVADVLGLRARRCAKWPSTAPT